MKKTLLTLVVAALALVAGCASTPAPSAVELGAKPAKLGFVSVATLATNACEAETAADYTAATVAVRRAASRVRDGAIARPDAEQIVRLAEHARAQLRDACAGGKADRTRIDAARADQARITQLLEKRP